MAVEDTGPDAARPAGLLGSLRNFAATLIGVAQTRLELLSAEVEEEWLRLIQLLAGLFLALFFFALGIVMLTLLVVTLFWDTHRALVTILFAVLYLGVGVYFTLAVRAKAREKTKLFSASIAELAKDRQQLADTHVHRKAD